MIGDVRNDRDLDQALRGVDAVYHLAAAVGVGQSMYQIAHYTSVNNLGTAQLLEKLSQKPVERLIVASSMSIYGEGQYEDEQGRKAMAEPRAAAMLASQDWTPRDEHGQVLQPIATSETKTAEPSSVYALSKWDQEQMCLMVGSAYKIPTVALRFFNIYGPRQSLSNPYTGVLAIFAARYLSDRPPLIFEDGLQRRDFVHVKDISRACRLALESPDAVGQVFNVGSGNSSTVREVAEVLGDVMGLSDIEPMVTQRYRTGDIRHCFADISKAQHLLHYAPSISLADGLGHYVEWLADQEVVDATEVAQHELLARGLAI